MTNNHEILPESKGMYNVAHWAHTSFPSVVSSFFDLIADNNTHLNNNIERMEVYLNHCPSGTSLKNLKHYIHLLKNGNFCQFDYGQEANLKIYDNLVPSCYELDKIGGMKIALYVGKEDKLSVLDDVNWLKEQISSNIVDFKVYENMGHLTFLMPKDLNWFNDVIELIKKYS